jgi:hypothetical protein
MVNLEQALPYSWHLRITQVDCRSDTPEMSILHAPNGCLQYFIRKAGAIASFNFDYISPIAPGQRYSVCFRQPPGACELQLKSRHFNMDSNDYISVFDPVDGDGIVIGKDRFGVADKFGILVANKKPFVIRVKTQPAESRGPRGTGFLMEYFISEGQC